MKIESYKANILYNAVSQRYTGELWVNNRLEQKTGNFLSEGLAVARLNKRIESFNAVNGTNIPPYQKRRRHESIQSGAGSERIITANGKHSSSRTEDS